MVSTDENNTIYEQQKKNKNKWMDQPHWSF